MVEKTITDWENDPALWHFESILASIHRFSLHTVISTHKKLNNAPEDIREKVRLSLQTYEAPLVQQVAQAIAEREENPVVRHYQDISEQITTFSAHTVIRVHDELKKLPEDVRAQVLLKLRTSTNLTIQKVGNTIFRAHKL